MYNEDLSAGGVQCSLSLLLLHVCFLSAFESRRSCLCRCQCLFMIMCKRNDIICTHSSRNAGPEEEPPFLSVAQVSLSLSGDLNNMVVVHLNVARVSP